MLFKVWLCKIKVMIGSLFREVSLAPETGLRGGREAQLGDCVSGPGQRWW